MKINKNIMMIRSMMIRHKNNLFKFKIISKKNNFRIKPLSCRKIIIMKKHNKNIIIQFKIILNKKNWNKKILRINNNLNQNQLS